MKKKKKPAPLFLDGPVFCAAIESRGAGKGLPFITQREGYYAGDQYLNARECRRLGQWLLNAADYLATKSVSGGSK